MGWSYLYEIAIFVFFQFHAKIHFIHHNTRSCAPGQRMFFFNKLHLNYQLAIIITTIK